MWTADDYITRGEYCDSSSLQAMLDRLRSSAGSSCAILLSCTRETLFQSLLLVSHEDPKVEERLQASLFSRRLYFRPEIVSQLERYQRAGVLNDATAAAMFELFAIDDIREAVDFRRARCVVEPAAMLDASPTALMTAIALADGQNGPKAVSRQLTRQLHSMINATAAVGVYRDSRRVLEIDRYIGVQDVRLRAGWDQPIEEEPAEGEVPESSPYHYFAQSILDAALALTKSTVGNIYLVSSHTRNLVLAAKERNAKPVPLIRRKDKTSVVAWVYRRGRPLLINDIKEFTRTHPEIGYLDVHSADSAPVAELAIPIKIRHPESTEPAVLGVINVEHDASGGYYTALDLAVLQQLADRFCLMRSEALLALSADSFAHLTRLSALSTAPTPPTQTPFRRRRRLGLIPSDLRPARTAINTTLNHVYTLTRSSTATIRLLSGDGQSAVRFCTFPDGHMSDRYRVIQIGSEGQSLSVNEWVVRHGRTCYLSNLDVDVQRYEGLARPLIARGSPKSELCLPLFVNGRIVGTMNLESVVPDAYAETQSVAHAIAEQVALGLAQARRSIEQAVFSFTASTTANTHDVLKLAEELSVSAKAKAPLDPVAVGDVAARILACISAMSVRPETTAMTLAEITSDVVAQSGMSRYVTGLSEVPDDSSYPPVIALTLKVAFGELIRNAGSAATTARGPFIVGLTAARRRMGGANYIVVRIANNALEPLDQAWCDKLYRYPISKNEGDRLHLGCYLVGALLRSIGGDVYIDASADGQFATVVEVPEVVRG